MRRTFQALVAFTVLLLAGIAAAFNWSPEANGRLGVPAINPDPRIKWSSFDVGGMLMAVPDSTGRPLRVIQLPDGSVLIIPFAVVDTTGDL